MSGASAVRKQSMADVLQDRCQACNFIKKRLQYRYFPMKFMKSLRTPFLSNTSTLMAASGSKQCKPMKTYTESLCCQERNIPERYFQSQCFQVMNIHLSFSKHCWQYPILVMLHEKARSSRPEVFCKKGIFENFANQRCFPVNFAKFSKTPFFIEHPRWLLLKS